MKRKRPKCPFWKPEHFSQKDQPKAPGIPMVNSAAGLDLKVRWFDSSWPTAFAPAKSGMRVGSVRPIAGRLGVFREVWRATT